MQWLIPVAMGLWAVWTWSQEREQERLTERTRLSALYVNPFMSACEDLQSRIYHVHELGGLRTPRKRYPDWQDGDEPDARAARHRTRYHLFLRVQGATALSALSNSQSVQQSLEALRNAEDPGTCQGGSREGLSPLRGRTAEVLSLAGA
jgi:hypothetical protein